jgi:hypothetical protein
MCPKLSGNDGCLRSEGLASHRSLHRSGQQCSACSHQRCIYVFNQPPLLHLYIIHTHTHTHQAASHIGGTTLHALRAKKISKTKQKDQTDAQQMSKQIYSNATVSSLHKIWDSCKFIILDEISMISIADMGDLSRRVNIGKNVRDDATLLGGLHCIFVGGTNLISTQHTTTTAQLSFSPRLLPAAARQWQPAVHEMVWSLRRIRWHSCVGRLDPLYCPG